VASHHQRQQCETRANVFFHIHFHGDFASPNPNGFDPFLPTVQSDARTKNRSSPATIALCHQIDKPTSSVFVITRHRRHGGREMNNTVEFGHQHLALDSPVSGKCCISRLNQHGCAPDVVARGDGITNGLIFFLAKWIT